MLKRALRLLVALTIALFALPSHTARAEGTEYTLRGHDLVINVDSRWTGCKFGGGYYPIRIQVTNRGPARNLTFRFEPHEKSLPVVVRTIGADQNATVQFSLSVPVVGQGSYGTLVVLSGGRRLEGLARNVSVPDLDYASFHRPSLLVISPTYVDTEQFALAVDAASAGGHAMHGGYTPGASSDVQLIPPTMLPDTWIDYSGLDLVAVPLDTLKALNRETRTAMLDWVHTGGTLIVYDVGAPPDQSPELARAAALDDHAYASPWQFANPQQRGAVPTSTVQPDGSVVVESGGSAFVLHGSGGTTSGMTTGVPSAKTPKPESRFLWPEGKEAFAWRDLMLGRVYAFEGYAFKGSAADWGWFLASLGPERYRWPARHGFAARMGNPEFLNFLIPNIRGVPVFAFLALITLFTIAIGPLNYFILWKRRQLFLLVLTIPIIAVVTSLSLFTYSTLAHGFAVKSRTRSVTFLDQQSKTAVSTSRISLFAGLSPSDGLRFSPETAVFPIWQAGEEFEGGQVNWTETQALGGSWLRSRTRTQFVTVSHRPARGRLIVSAASDGKLGVENGFEWPIRGLIVRGADGNMYAGGELPAGASTRLARANRQDLSEVLRVIRENPLEIPAGADAYSNYNARHYYHSVAYMYGSPEQYRTSFSHGLMEQHLTKLLRLPDGSEPLPKNSYVVIFGQNPGIELGVPKTKAEGDLHVLIGRF